MPATAALIGLIDRLFTRVGSTDDLAAGASTFLVEMAETANILRHATPRSLVVLDEVGRGTSTHDGLCIAQAVLEHLHDAIGARTLFATHFHELTALSRHPRRRAQRDGRRRRARRGDRVPVPGGARRGRPELRRSGGAPGRPAGEVTDRATALLEERERTASSNGHVDPRVDGPGTFALSPLDLAGAGPLPPDPLSLGEGEGEAPRRLAPLRRER